MLELFEAKKNYIGISSIFAKKKNYYFSFEFQKHHFIGDRFILTVYRLLKTFYLKYLRGNYFKRTSHSKNNE